MEEASSVEPLSIVFAALLCLGVYLLAQRKRFFNLPPPIWPIPLNFRQMAGGFLLYLAFALLAMPLILITYSMIMFGAPLAYKAVAKEELQTIQVVALYLLFLLMSFYCFALKKETRRFIFWQDGESGLPKFFRGIGMGALTWIISYPFVWCFSLLIQWISELFWGMQEVEQEAVKELKMTLDRPYLFGLLFIVVGFLVPFIEEFLFRGLLQNYLKKKWGRGLGMTATALIFACAHFSIAQGLVGNFQLIPSLFVLALFLGFLYEREKTLWAPIGLHMTFNTLSALVIMFSQ